MKNALHNSLKRLIEEGGKQNFLIINLGENYYIQVAGELYSSHLLLETVSNHYLPADKQLNIALQQKIITLGWIEPQREGNYSYEVSINSADEYNSCIEFIEKTAKDIFEVDLIEKSMIELNLE